MRKEQTADHAASDSGRNFGRLARSGVMDEYVKRMLDQLIAGVPARAWIDFFTKFERPSDTDTADADTDEVDD
jgi:hypothetical protein